jgi:flagellar hook-associated protein 3 FlgL
MTRVSTMSLQNTLANAMSRAQQNLADSNIQLDTQKKVQSYADLGGNTGRVLSAASMLAQQQAQSSVAKRVDTTLGFYKVSLGTIDDSMSDLRTKLLKAFGTGDSADLDSSIQQAFTDLRDALNTNEAGVPIFAGSQTDSEPFAPQKLSDLTSLATPGDAFTNDDVRTSARLSDNVDTQYGIGASDIGTGLVQAFTTLAGLGSFGAKLTQAQMNGIQTAMGQLDQGLTGLRGVDAKNGDMMNQVEGLGKRADARADLLTNVIGDAEDADMGQVATDISTRTTILNASYAAFQKLNNLSLLNFLTNN